MCSQGNNNNFSECGSCAAATAGEVARRGIELRSFKNLIGMRRSSRAKSLSACSPRDLEALPDDFGPAVLSVGAASSSNVFDDAASSNVAAAPSTAVNGSRRSSCSSAVQIVSPIPYCPPSPVAHPIQPGSVSPRPPLQVQAVPPNDVAPKCSSNVTCGEGSSVKINSAREGRGPSGPQPARNSEVATNSPRRSIHPSCKDPSTGTINNDECSTNCVTRDASNLSCA